MKNINRPAFILAMISTALILIGLVTMPHNEIGTYIMYTGFLLAGIFWIWAIWDVIAAHDLKYYQKMFWLIITISVPVMGGLLFYILHQRPNKIVT
ncbi:PLDc N-terminal domain-containing protein [Paraflavitalea speifideaquila]|uniref:PLDc N-terminal domain-containing protein n=1 Tax=Paraflavitalea speifideaquila TaxID=3076558 RepID=UPI0028EE9720|nr:PLDc N-terminal domain-containing protein [Paraflavitalea speifideiaquila]